MSTTYPVPRDFGFGDDAATLRDVARKFLDERLPVTTLRALVAEAPEPIYDLGQQPRWDQGLWSEIVALGWAGLAVPEEHGGTALSLAGIAGLVEEVGRHALPSPLIPTLSTSFVLRATGGDIAAAVLARIAAGAAATLAITDERGSWEPRNAPVDAEVDADGIVLTGVAAFVQDASKVDLLIVSARLGDAIALCAVPVDAAGVTISADHIHDLTRDQATVRFDGVRVPADGVVSRDAAGALDEAWPALLVLVAADLCGCAEWQLQTTVEYASTRRQFDREIGFFQAVKHPLVDAMVWIDQARSLLYSAAAEFDAGTDRVLLAARMAKSAASDAGAYVSDRSVQLHGGIGFTWECDVHIFFKRSMHNQVLLGDGVHHRHHLADVIVGPIESGRDHS